MIGVIQRPKETAESQNHISYHLDTHLDLDHLKKLLLLSKIVKNKMYKQTTSGSWESHVSASQWSLQSVMWAWNRYHVIITTWEELKQYKADFKRQLNQQKHNTD